MNFFAIYERPTRDSRSKRSVNLPAIEQAADANPDELFDLIIECQESGDYSKLEQFQK